MKRRARLPAAEVQQVTEATLLPPEAPSRTGSGPSVTALSAEVLSQLAATREANLAVVTQLRDELRQSRAELRELRQERTELTAAVSQLKVLERALAKAEASNGAAGKQNQKQQQLLQTAQQENEELTALCQQLEAAVKQLSQERDLLREELLCLEDQVAQQKNIIRLLELKQQLK